MGEDTLGQGPFGKWVVQNVEPIEQIFLVFPLHGGAHVGNEPAAVWVVGLINGERGQIVRKCTQLSLGCVRAIDDG